MTMTSEKGLYVLAMKMETERTIRVGKLGEFTFPVGIYLYVGSAWGPGGLKARVRRHIARAGKNNGSPHWHVDYLLPFVEIESVATFPDERDECTLAETLADVPGAVRFPAGFGATDCGCPGHLIFLTHHSPLATRNSKISPSSAPCG